MPEEHPPIPQAGCSMRRGAVGVARVGRRRGAVADAADADFGACSEVSVPVLSWRSRGQESWWPCTAPKRAPQHGRGQSPWGWCCPCSFGTLGGGFQCPGACSAACSVRLQCRGAALRAPSLQRAAWALAPKGTPLCAGSVPAWSGQQREGAARLQRAQGMFWGWRRVRGCLVTAQQRGDAVPTDAVCRGCVVPRGGSGAMCGVGSGAASLGFRAGHCPCSCGAVGGGQRPTCSAGWVVCGAPASLQRWMGGAFAVRSWQCFAREGRAALSLLWQCPVSLQCPTGVIPASQAQPPSLCCRHQAVLAGRTVPCAPRVRGRQRPRSLWHAVPPCLCGERLRPSLASSRRVAGSRLRAARPVSVPGWL
ncbi:uncharacterized protein LOC118173898 isoform X2 [Oxyura jamaicensis]|uniref:uncharacterized protein LOC118173898 isoform X2 n=1 Tax=Oxyura jamaicensis TaxID=8884 RepID=UPI0015A702A6|nr:uncharacterized protein LOC118173898 isoform X2 [Oxyura jamaicensis]